MPFHPLHVWRLDLPKSRKFWMVVICPSVEELNRWADRFKSKDRWSEMQRQGQ